jgi:hypothetical protein
MSFMARSAFWLGLVYSAMPFDSGSPTAATTAAATPRAANLSLGTLAAVAIPTSRQNRENWKSAVEVAAALCARDCLRPAPAGLGLSDAPAQKDRAEPRRRPSPEKSN